MASTQSTQEYSFHRNLHKTNLEIIGGKVNFLFTRDGRKVFDAASGAAVSCLGHGNERVIQAISEQLKTGTPYLSSAFWKNEVVEELCRELINGTDGKMARVYLTGSGSGSEAM
uniref:Aminotransferase class-III n=1 Tax=Cryphonectria parasitica TaxID=5116 RepID=A0A191MXH7_CRYPA|nr:aminotransferase class-III [Cryphonectria parasitica]